MKNKNISSKNLKNELKEKAENEIINESENKEIFKKINVSSLQEALDAYEKKTGIKLTLKK